MDVRPYLAAGAGRLESEGVGREGPRFAIEDYTEPRLLVVNR